MATKKSTNFSPYATLLLFLALELISFYLVVTQNDAQRQTYLSSSNAVTGRIHVLTSGISTYFGLQKKNAALMDENARLRSQLDESKYRDDLRVDTMTVPGDTLLQQFTYIPARVVKNSTASARNILTIDKGEKHGVERNMGLITPEGMVAGVVRKSSRHFSSIISILHADSRISAALSRSGYFGSLVWPGKSSRLMVLKDIPRHADVVKGDTVVTSGYSSIFPKGLPLGTVQSIKPDAGGANNELEVRLFGNPATFKNVYIIQNRLRAELDTLEQH